MDIKNIHLILIVISIVLFLLFGLWTLQHSYMVWAYSSFVIAAGLIVYCVQFIKKMKVL